MTHVIFKDHPTSEVMMEFAKVSQPQKGPWCRFTHFPFSSDSLSHNPTVIVPQARNNHFIDRQETLAQLQKLCNPAAEHHPFTRLALIVDPWLGKTGIATEYVHWLRTAFPEISIFWVDATDRQSFQNSCYHIVREVAISDRVDYLTRPYHHLLEQFLKGSECGPWVLVLANISHPQLQWKNDEDGSEAAITGAFSPITLPGPASGCILTTTESSIVAKCFTFSEHDIQLSVENLATDANLFLQEDAEDPETPGNDVLLKAWLGPDFAAHAAAKECIRANSLNISDFFQLFDQNKMALMHSQRRKHDERESPPLQIAVTWMISFNRIQLQNEFAGELLSIIGFLAWSAIPLEFFKKYLEQKLQEKEMPFSDYLSGRYSRADGILSLFDKYSIEGAINLLKKYKLVRTTEDDCLAVNQFVQETIRDWLYAKSPSTYTQYARHALEIVSEIYPDGLQEFITSRALLVHAYKVLSLDGLDSTTDKMRKADILHNIAGLYMAQFEWEDAMIALSSSVQFKKEVWGDTHESTISTMERLVLNYRNQGWVTDSRFSGAQVWEMTLEPFRNGPIPPMLNSDTMARLISHCETRGQWREAERLQVCMLQASKALLGEDSNVTWKRALDLARILARQGRLEDAEVLQQRVSDQRERLARSKSVDTLSVMALQKTMQTVSNPVTESKSQYGTNSDSGYASASRDWEHNTQSQPVQTLPKDPQTVDLQDDIRSLVSDDDDIGSQASEGTKGEVITGQALIRVFFTEQSSFTTLCDKALTRMGMTRFENNMRRLLKSFHRHLHKEAKTEAERAVAGLLRSRKGRLRISQQLAAYIELEQGGGSTFDTSILEIAQENKDRVEIWLTRATERLYDTEVTQLPTKAATECAEDEFYVWDSDDDEEEGEVERREFHYTAEMKEFLRNSLSFRQLHQELIQMFLPAEINDVLQSIPKSQISLSQKQDETFLNNVKAWVEDRSRLRWNWWPLPRRKRRLFADEARMSWRCTCGSQEWTEVSTEQHDLLLQLLSLMDETPSRSHWCRIREDKGTTWWSLGIGQTNPSTSSAAAQRYTPSSSTIPCACKTSPVQGSAASTAAQPNAAANAGSGCLATSQQTQTSANQLSQSESWILFGAQGSRRTLIPVQISINSQTTDYNLFQELKRCYQAHRGWFKLWFSIWRLDYCEFVRFNRLTTQRIVREFRDLPAPLEYEYNPRAGSIDARNPPISPHQFHALFYGCESPCKWVLPHDCMAPPATVTCLERIPKRTRNFLDQVSPIWGFEAVFEVSFAYVLLYHCLMVAGPFAFWAWWVTVHPGDLQNASIPMTVVLGALSLFWSSAGILTSSERMKSVEVK